MAWLNLTMPNQTVKNDLKVRKIKFSRKTANKISMYLLAPYILQNFKNILRADPVLWGCAIFEPKMTYLSWTKLFWYKPFWLLALFIVQNFKKFLQQIQIYENVPFLGPKWSICPPQKYLFWYKQLLVLSSTYWFFSLCKV